MLPSIPALLADLAAIYHDRRIHVFDVKPSHYEGDHVTLEGRVLDDATLQTLRSAMAERLPYLVVDTSKVQVLRQAEPCQVHVATNLTSIHAEPSWLAEMLSQVAFGVQLEILEQRGSWVLARQSDGYLGWAYRPYLSEVPAPAPTYLVASPVAPLYAEPNAASPLHSRLVGGTFVQIVTTRGGWAEADAHMWGWVPISDLRPLNGLPQSADDRRKCIAADAARWMGVPYLWGGTSAFGIDCSGLAQLVYRLAGLAIPRDADQQYEAGKKIEPPFGVGDLLFFGEKEGKRAITHVAISLGEWKIIHSSRSRNGVYLDDVQEVAHLRESFIGAATYL